MTMISIDFNLDRIKRVLSQGNIDRAQYDIMNQLLADMNQYVPYRKNPLRMSAHVSSDKQHLVWRTPYAENQFYGGNRKQGVVYKNYTTAGTGKRWDLVASANHMQSWERVFADALGV